MPLPIHASMFLWRRELVCPVTIVKSFSQKKVRVQQVALTGTALRQRLVAMEITAWRDLFLANDSLLSLWSNNSLRIRELNNEKSYVYQDSGGTTCIWKSYSRH